MCKIPRHHIENQNLPCSFLATAFFFFLVPFCSCCSYFALNRYRSMHSIFWPGFLSLSLFVHLNITTENYIISFVALFVSFCLIINLIFTKEYRTISGQNVINETRPWYLCWCWCDLHSSHFVIPSIVFIASSSHGRNENMKVSFVENMLLRST